MLTVDLKIGLYDMKVRLKDGMILSSNSSFGASAAVLIILLREKGRESILLTKRSSQLREHAGEVALPGGKFDEVDTSLYRTALRESHEEVGINESAPQFMLELPPQMTRQGTIVTPFVSMLTSRPSLVLCEEEIESAFWVPVSLFREDRRSFTHIFQSSEGEFWAPVYHFEGYKIWGFTARVMVSFVNAFYAGLIRRTHPSAPEKLYSLN